MTPDLIARQVIIAAYCYYVLDDPITEDAKFDRACETVAKKWDALHPDRQWALGSPDAIRASGFHIKFSSAAVYGALSAYKKKTGQERPAPTTWYLDSGFRYVTCAGGPDNSDIEALL
jgi:hypothetical protein